MSLQLRPIPPIPEPTVRVAHAASPRGNPYLRLRDELGTVCRDEHFADLYPKRGQPALAPWRLAWITGLQFRDHLSDRRAVAAVHARRDGKYRLSLERTDLGFDATVLCACRSRLLAGDGRGTAAGTAARPLQGPGADPGPGPAADRCWPASPRRGSAAWPRRRGTNTTPAGSRTAAGRGATPERAADTRTVGEEGFLLLDRLGSPEAPAELQTRPPVDVLRRVWERPFERRGGAGGGLGRRRPEGERPPAPEGIESASDPAACSRRPSGRPGTGSAAVLTETCDAARPHLMTQVATTTAAVHKVNGPTPVPEARVGRGLPPGAPRVDAGFGTAELLVSGRDEHGLRLIRPPRKDASGPNRTAGAYGVADFVIDWEQKPARCSPGRLRLGWTAPTDSDRSPSIAVRFSAADCRDWPVRSRCTQASKQGRHLKVPAEAQSAALREMHSLIDSEEGRRLDARRAGIAGTIAPGVRSFGLRRSRSRGPAKAHLQPGATAVALNFSRVSDGLEDVPRAATRIARFARLAA